MMDPIYAYVAFIDVLGYRHGLEKDRHAGELLYLAKLRGALKVLETINEAVYQVNAISDTLLITCAKHDEFIGFLNILRDIFKSFLSERIFVRGGVAYSRHFQTQQLTYSHALARAYEMESTRAIYPRIVFDTNVVQMHKSAELLPGVFGSGFFCHQNGTWFLNVATDDSWGELYHLAKGLYENDREMLLSGEREFAKHLWFQSYLFDLPYADRAEKRYIPKMEIE